MYIYWRSNRTNPEIYGPMLDDKFCVLTSALVLHTHTVSLCCLGPQWRVLSINLSLY